MMARSDVMIGILIVMNHIQHMLVQPATNLPKLNTKVVFVILPLHLVYSLTIFPKLNKDVISECPINYEDVYMKMLNISCQNGTRWACVPNARNSAEMLSFCKPADLECPAGTTGSFTANGDTVTMVIETCPPETYKKHVSDCVDACHQKRTDFFQIPKEFAVYSNGSNTEPPQIYCNASAGWYNNKNKTFFDFDSDFTFELGYKIMCLNVKDQNPCVNGLLVLPNGTCVNQQQRDHFMLQLERNIIDEGSRNNKSNITIQPSTTTAKPVKTTTEPSSNNLTSEGNSTQVKSWFNQETFFKIAGTLGGVLFILGVSFVSCYVWCRHRREKENDGMNQATARPDGYQPVARKEIENEENEATGRPDASIPSASSTAPSSSSAKSTSMTQSRVTSVNSQYGPTDPINTVVVDNFKHPEYKQLDARVSSFQNWPDSLPLPIKMAEAMFFYVEIAGLTRCCCCGGGLRNWKEGDDPIKEHARWFRECDFVKKLKENGYVDDDQSRQEQNTIKSPVKMLPQARIKQQRPSGTCITGAAKLRKKKIDNISQSLHNSLNSQFPFVGAVIINEVKQGTGFCVRGRYVFSALHVVSDACSYEDGTVDENRLRHLDRLDIHINFNELVTMTMVRRNLLKYCYHIIHLDVIVMELESVVTLPGCMSLSTNDEEVQIVHVIGWGIPKDSERKYIDPMCDVIKPGDNIIEEAKAHLSRLNPESQGYEGCDNQQILLYDGNFEFGGSGSPLLASNNAETTEVVGMLLEGAPGDYFNLPEEEKHRFPKEYFFNVAVKMSSIFSEINEKDPHLAHSIFGRN